MSKFNKVQSSFQRGLISKSAQGRIDLEDYFQGSSVFKNFIPQKQGGAFKRGGLKYVQGAESSLSGFLPFKGSDGFSYWFEVDNRPGDAGFITGVNSSTLAAVTIDDTQYTGDIHVATPILLPADMAGWTYVQLVGGMVVTHSSGEVVPFVIRRLADGTFTISPIFVPDVANPLTRVLNVPYRDINTGSATTLTPSVTAGSGTLTASASFFVPEQVGTIFKITQGAQTGACVLDSYNSSTSMGMTVVVNFLDLSASDAWQESSWSEYRGWPRTVVSHQQRMVWGGNSSQEDTVWGSLTGNYFHMMANKLVQDEGATTDVSGIGFFGDGAITDPFVFTLASTEQNAITWMRSLRTLNIGTEGEEYIATGGDQILGSESVSFLPQTTYGGLRTPPIAIGNEVMYIDNTAKRVRNFRYSDSNGSNISDDLTSLAQDALRNGRPTAGSIGDWGAKKIIYHKKMNIAWVLTNDGALIGLKYAPEMGTLAWFEVVFGLPVGILDMTVVGGDLYLIDIANIYKLGDVYNEDSITQLGVYPNYLDGSIEEVSTDTQVIGGLLHLSGETVTVTKDGLLLGTYLVVGASIDLGSVQAGEHRYVVGMPYIGEIASMDIEAGGDFGPSQGMMKNVSEVIVKMLNTLDLKVGIDENQLEPYAEFAQEVVSGYIQYLPSDIPDRAHKIKLSSALPYPCNILLYAAKGESDDA